MHSYGSGTEHFIIDALAISLVAEVSGRVVGHIASSPIEVFDGSWGWYRLGPVAVLPEHQGQPGAHNLRHIASQTALGRVDPPDDIGGAISSLLTGENRWMTGQRIQVSGGIFL